MNKWIVAQPGGPSGPFWSIVDDSGKVIALQITDGKQAQDIADWHNNQIESDGITGVMITSGYGYNTKQPFVQMIISAADWMTQMTPETARELAFNLLQAAEAAHSDGFMVTFLREKVGVTDNRSIATMIAEFRQHRETCRFLDATGK